MSHIERGVFSLLKRKRYRFIAFRKIVLSDQGLAEHGGGGGLLVNIRYNGELFNLYSGKNSNLDLGKEK